MSYERIGDTFMYEHRYYHIGQVYGIALSAEVIDSIQAALEKKVAAYISKRSKKLSPVRAKLCELQGSTQKPPCSCSAFYEDECGKVIEARAAANRRLLAVKRQRSITETIASYKTYMSSLDAFVKKTERQSDLQYRQFLLGAASRRTASKPPEFIRFASKVYQEHTECLRKEIGNYEH